MLQVTWPHHSSNSFLIKAVKRLIHALVVHGKQHMPHFLELLKIAGTQAAPDAACELTKSCAFGWDKRSLLNDSLIAM